MPKIVIEVKTKRLRWKNVLDPANLPLAVAAVAQTVLSLQNGSEEGRCVARQSNRQVA